MANLIVYPLPTLDQLPVTGWLEQRFRGAPPTKADVEIFAQEPFQVGTVPEVKFPYNSYEKFPPPVTIRWSRRFYSNGQPYKFDLVTDDGMRLKINGQVVWEKWFPQNPSNYSHTATLPVGWHVVTVEYFNSHPTEAVAICDVRIDKPAGTPPEPPPPPVEKPVQFVSSLNKLTIRMRVIELPQRTQEAIVINMRVKPAAAKFDGHNKHTAPSRLAIVPLDIPLRSALRTVATRLMDGKVANYYDIDRELKTVLNFGQDYQALATAWKYDDSRKNRGGIVVKLYRPLPTEVTPHTQLWISRELAYPLIDRAYLVFMPDASQQLYLRPPNRNVALTKQSGMAVNNVTLSKLFTSGGLDDLNPTSQLDEWYTSDFNSVELNVDYSDYRNFVFYGSAQSRLQAFINKLAHIEELDRIIALSSGSLTGVLSSGSLAYPSIRRLADEKVTMIRSFDAYERFLYYETGIPYSASHVTDDYQDQIHFHADATWPKISGSIASVDYASASLWTQTQMAIAEHFDRHNQDYLGNNLPFYLKNDENSADFVKFFDLVGHQFDTAKLYVDHMPYMYDRSSDPTTGLSQDIVWNVAEAFGVSLPNPYAIKTLVDYTVGEVTGSSAKVYRQAAAETWKRFLHNHIFMMKTKGTKQSLQALINAYGILPTVLRIRESATPGFSYPSGTFEVYEEQTNALRFNQGAYVTIPWASVAPQTVEVRFAPSAATESVIFNVGGDWALKAVPLSGTYGRLEVTDGLATRISSSYMPLFNGEMFSTMLRYNADGVELFVKRAEHDDLVYESYMKETSTVIAGMWDIESFLYLGANGTTFGNDFVGLVDEFRMWTEPVSESIFDMHVKYPGLYNGNTLTSARDHLKLRLSFNTPKNLGGSSKVIPNESPAARLAGAAANLMGVSASAFTSITTAPYNMDLTTREVLRYAPNAGSQFTTNKTIIADPPVFKYVSDGSGSQIPVLSHNQSMVSLNQKRENSRSSNVIGFYFSLTDAVNDNMIRSIGNFDLQNLIGDPADMYSAEYSALGDLNEIYWSHYAYSYNVNSFVDFVKNLLGPLFQQAKELIPARAKLLSGIVHEPHILERSKVKNKPLQMSAGQYGRNEDTQNLEAYLGTTEPDYDASVPYHETTLDTSDTQEVLAESLAHETTLDTTEHYNVVAEQGTHEGSINTTETFELASIIDPLEMTIDTINNSEFVTADFLVFDDETNRVGYLANLLAVYGVDDILDLAELERQKVLALLSKYRSQGTINVAQQYFQPASEAVAGTDLSGYVVTPVLPVTDFSTIESYTYFTDVNGLVGTDNYVRVRTNQNILVSRGEWTKGEAYARNEYVSSGSLEFVCITTDTPFISYIDPRLDPGNWKSMTYQTVATVVPKKAIVVSGSVSLAPADSTQPIITGYHPTHYKFTRDSRRGRLNHQFLGCLQTDDTTTDGEPAVVITDSAGNSLYVNNPNEPIQPRTNTAGPILDVK